MTQWMDPGRAGAVPVALGEIFAGLFGADAPVRFTAYDGSGAGRRDAPLGIRLTRPRAASYLATAPGSLGMVRAYLQGDLELEGVHPGNPYPLMRLFEDNMQIHVPSPLQALRWLRGLGLRTLVPPAPPAQEVRARPFDPRHGKRRDADAISHHYDVSNRFYELVLGPSMAYTCACYPADDATLEQAQEYKHDLVARKLGLQPGMRLLDVGCGWGGMVRHAAKNYGVSVLGVTLSAEQARWARERNTSEGLDHLVEVRHLDYRHPGLRRRGFIGRYVFPDGELTGSGDIVCAMEDAGLEVQHQENLRVHYARTLQRWCENLEENWDECVAEADLATAKIWGLYMAGSRLAFERNGIQLHQVLAARTSDHGENSYPLRPHFEP